MEIIKGIIGVYMSDPIWNTIIIVGVLVLGWFLWVYRKLEVLALTGSIKAELQELLKGEEKLNFALKWVIKQNFYKNTLLKFIPENIIKSIINIIYKRNKGSIEAK